MNDSKITHYAFIMFLVLMLAMVFMQFKTHKLLKIVYKSRYETFNINNVMSENSKKITALTYAEMPQTVINPVLEKLRYQLVDHFKIYSVYDEKGPLKLVRLGRELDGVYITPEKACLVSDVLLGYGIAGDSSFEEHFSSTYNKPSYGFDCGGNFTTDSHNKNKLYTFVAQCIGTDKFLYSGQRSSNDVASFSTQLNNLKLNEKKLFIKMDIEGAEYEAFEDIFKHSANITGIVLELHFDDTNIEKAISLLDNLQKDFLLIHVHNNNCCFSSVFTSKNVKRQITQALELTFINKSLVTNYHISENQKFPITGLDLPNCPHLPEIEFEILPDQGDLKQTNHVNNI